MKICKKIVCLLVIFIIFCSCGVKDKNKESILDYFPFEKNKLYIYKSEDSIGNQEIYTTYINDNKIQQKISAPNNEVTAVLEYKHGELKQKYSNLDFYAYENLTDIKSNSNLTILKEPLKVGTKWKSPNGGESKITSMNKKIDTSFGQLETMEVTTISNNLEEKVYYAKGIGVVKTEYSTIRDGCKRHVISFLEKIEKDVPMEVNFNLYYPDKDLKINNKPVKLKINTNENIVDILEKYIRDYAINNKLYLIPKDTKINFIEVDREKSIVNLDLNENFISEMNLGASYEDVILKSIASSLCNFYNVKNMRITIDNKPYSSGHISYDKDDLISLDEIN